MQSAQLVLALLIAVAVLVTIGIAYPIFLVIGGLLLGLVPGLPRVQVDTAGARGHAEAVQIGMRTPAYADNGAWRSDARCRIAAFGA